MRLLGPPGLDSSSESAGPIFPRSVRVETPPLPRCWQSRWRFRSAATSLRCLEDTYLSELRTRWTMHNWTRVCGNTVSIASGSPASPSRHPMKQSCMPRLCNCVKTESQKRAPSFSDIHIPSNSFCPSIVTPNARETALLVTRHGSHARITHETIHVQDGVQWLSRAILRTLVRASMTSSVTFEINVGETSTPYNPWS